MNNHLVSGLLIRVPKGAGVRLLAAEGSSLGATGLSFDIRPLFTTTHQGGAALGAAAGSGFDWHIARPKGDLAGAHPWELSHAAQAGALGLTSRAPVFIEPDLLQEWMYRNPLAHDAQSLAAGETCVFNDQLGLPGVARQFAWHLGDDYSQLRSARSIVSAPPKGKRICIAHLDTGYDPNHSTFQKARMLLELQRDFLSDPPGRDAHDPGARGLLKNPGHGTGTLSILAGGRFRFSNASYDPFDDFIGGAPQVDIVPIRVGKSVVQILTSSVAAGISYAADLCADESTQVHVMSMSMGGVASKAWADAVNKAYEAGITYVAAAGNNFSAGIFGIPTRFIVYPARFQRVIAACGVMANKKPYYDLAIGSMQGNWGPQSKMATALSAFTPNIPWAELGCAEIVDMDGQGTSAATPQIAAAAALYLQKNAGDLFDPNNYPEAWMRVEAARFALFSSADKGSDAEKLGNGILKAAQVMAVPLRARQDLRRTPPDEAILPFLHAFTGLGAAPADPGTEMLALEATQLLQRWDRTDSPNPFELLGTDPDSASIAPARQREIIEHLYEHPYASRQLRSALAKALGQKPPGGSAKPGRSKASKTGPAAPMPVKMSKSPEPAPARFIPAEPPFRALRGFSIDPSLATDLSTVHVSQITFHVPWEKLSPGPLGEYLEVIDIDPGSNRYYEPVNLDDPALLAQDGLAPSEGTPQFHQQMVYAVASLTIHNFEQALGRRALWRPGPSPDPKNPKDDSNFVQRLRIHPHALREKNAYYTPQKVALLFGYFNASHDNPGQHMPGEMVFACLSHDIIAHETTHALLDGMTRAFIEPTNPDVLAFHEAFADLVALFQHFTFPEIVRSQINNTQGKLRTQQNLLGELAGQFGRGMGLRGALRSAIGTQENGAWTPHLPDPQEYDNTTEPHARGAILVAAVFDAFLSIYERRAADLLRLATGGTGLLNPGAIHPDLAQRLADEASKCARHVLTICLRALDYCPPVDITFGEFLRALITADFDLVPDDDLHYRVAFIEAFRRRGIFPRGLRTLSQESLLWRGPEAEDTTGPSERLQKSLLLFRSYAEEGAYSESRKQTFESQRSMRRDIHQWLRGHFHSDPNGGQDAAYLGIDPAHPFEVRSARFAYRTSPDGGMIPQLLVNLLQEQMAPVDPSFPAGEQMPFQGGCTIIGDLRQAKVRYCIRKSFNSQSRLEYQQQFAQEFRASARSTYFGPSSGLGAVEPFAALHRGI